MDNPTLFPVEDFDGWADSYDADIQAVSGFPLEGYLDVLERLVELAQVQPGMRVLDLGCGTGNLTQRFVDLKCAVLGSDFSPRMLSLARAKLPGVPFILHDLNQALPREMDGPFERIVSAYTFHHFPLAGKIDLLSRLADRLSSGGMILMADISFENAAVQEELQQELGSAWEEEYYWLADETLAALAGAGMQADYEQVCCYAGIYRILPNHGD